MRSLAWDPAARSPRRRHRWHQVALQQKCLVYQCEGSAFWRDMNQLTGVEYGVDPKNHPNFNPFEFDNAESIWIFHLPRCWSLQNPSGERRTPCKVLLCEQCTHSYCMYVYTCTYVYTLQDVTGTITYSGNFYVL